VNVLINQPVGLGDIIYCQPIADWFIQQGYEVYWPVKNVYLEQVRTYMPKDHLHWVAESDNFPLKEYYEQDYPDKVATPDMQQYYLPLTHSYRHHPSCSVMMSKYYFASVPLVDWREHLIIQRNKEREQRLIDTYHLTGNFIIVNDLYGTWPDSKHAWMNWKKYEDLDRFDAPLVHQMDPQVDHAHGFTLFDWIGAFQKAQSIHTVNTSVSYLVDAFSHRPMYMYERKTDPQLTYYFNTSHVARNPKWTFDVS